MEAELEAELKVELGKKAEQLAKKGLAISPSTPPHRSARERVRTDSKWGEVLPLATTGGGHQKGRHQD